MPQIQAPPPELAAHEAAGAGEDAHEGGDVGSRIDRAHEHPRVLQVPGHLDGGDPDQLEPRIAHRGPQDVGDLVAQEVAHPLRAFAAALPAHRTSTRKSTRTARSSDSQSRLTPASTSSTMCFSPDTTATPRAA